MAEAIAALYAQVDAPAWAARNLDAVADVLRDLSWLPEGPVTVRLPGGLGPRTAARLRSVLALVEADTADGPRPLRLLD